MNKPKALSIIGFCTSFIIAPLGLALSIVGYFLHKKAKTGKEGLAVAGIVIGGIFTPFFFMVLLIVLGFVSGNAHYQNTKTSFQPILKIAETYGLQKVCETDEGISESFNGSKIYYVWYTTDKGTGILDTINSDLKSQHYIYKLEDGGSFSERESNGVTYNAQKIVGEYSSDLKLQYDNAHFSVTVYEAGKTVVDCDGSYDKQLTPINSGLNVVEMKVY